MKLNDKAKGMIDLINRSEQDLDGWCSVNKVLIPFVTGIASEWPTLFEMQDNKIRLTPFAEQLMKTLDR